MSRRYYSSRSKNKSLSIEELYWKLQNLYPFFRDRDFFKGQAGITEHNLPDSINHKAAFSIGFHPFPITKWESDEITEDRIFDVIEFLYDHVAEPGELVSMTTDEGYDYSDYDGYDVESGKKEFREKVNAFLCDFGNGYELSEDGMILSIGDHGLKHILDAEIIPYDEINVDSKVRDAIIKWRNRHLDIRERKQAIRELADVFEWLKKTKKISKILSRKDESAIFEIANKFSIRHHDPNQKREYDESIWYAWIFHFYLATYHAVIRMLKKLEG